MPSNANPVRPFVQPPMTADINMRAWMNWIHQAVIQLQTASNPAPAAGGIQSLNPNAIDPTTAQLISRGARTASVTTSIAFVATTSQVQLYWDGTNGSHPLTIYRDDNSQIGPTIVGSPQIISGLASNTTYFFYPYWDDVAQRVKFAVGDQTGVGTPPYAFTLQNLKAVQQTILKGNIPLGILAATTGVLTATTTNLTGNIGNGGGGVGAGGGKYFTR